MVTQPVQYSSSTAHPLAGESSEKSTYHCFTVFDATSPAELCYLQPLEYNQFKHMSLCIHDVYIIFAASVSAVDWVCCLLYYKLQLGILVIH